MKTFSLVTCFDELTQALVILVRSHRPLWSYKDGKISSFCPSSLSFLQVLANKGRYDVKIYGMMLIPILQNLGLPYFSKYVV